ncbi:MAG: 4'-phosphopantetheinyl transferase superfamily protein [Pseudomonadota bacterium]|nr:4'-phosphopantetheinyl transferase superfamily protein [Pseudomonadota bacterium]
MTADNDWHDTGACPIVIPHGVVDIWTTELSKVTRKQADRYVGLLTAPELERFRRFVVPGAALQFLVARALLRTVLSQYVAAPVTSWRFLTSSYGKPYIAYPDNSRLNVRFNLSHTDGLAACAISAGMEVGVDVENHQRRIAVQDLVSSTFTQQERVQLDGLDEVGQRRLFFAIWTLKEAYVKACGQGLSLALDAFWFDLSNADIQLHYLHRGQDVSSDWFFARFQPTLEHDMALAVKKPTDGGKIKVRICRLIPP